MRRCTRAPFSVSSLVARASAASLSASRACRATRPSLQAVCRQPGSVASASASQACWAARLGCVSALTPAWQLRYQLPPYQPGRPAQRSGPVALALCLQSCSTGPGCHTAATSALQGSVLEVPPDAFVQQHSISCWEPYTGRRSSNTHCRCSSTSSAAPLHPLHIHNKLHPMSSTKLAITQVKVRLPL